MRVSEQHRAAIDAQRAAHARMQEAVDQLDQLMTTADASEEARAAAVTSFEEAEAAYTAETRNVERFEAVARARELAPRDAIPAPPAEAKDPERKADLDYRPDGRSFFTDLIRCKEGDPEARDRLVKNNRHRVDVAPPEKRAGLTQAAGAGGEFIYPVWLEEWVAVRRAGRAFADQCLTQPYAEDTNSINVPKITTGASVANQSDGASVSNTDLVTTSVTAQTMTLAGRTVAAYQDIDLGQAYIDRMIFMDLQSALDVQVDTAYLNNNATNQVGVLNASGVNAVTYTDAAPSPYKLWSPVMQAKSQIEKGYFGEVDFAVMHPSTWNWLLSGLDTQDRPLFLSQELPAFNVMARFNPNATGVAGNFAGIPVVVDANVPVNTGAGVNQSPIILCNRNDLYTYEGTPRFKIADQTSIATLQYQFVMYQYVAFTFARYPKAVSVINGTGLIVQSGF